MKKTRAISLLLSLSLICAMLVPGAAAFAENESPSDSGMVINKTATANTDGSYTITLEAYATGSKVISEVKKDIPTDIVLVLDQSGSMAQAMSTYDFRAYTNRSNSYLYDRRHNNNGNNGNLYYPLEDGSYATVSVTVQEGGLTYTKITNGRNNQSGWDGEYTNYWDNKDNLYALVNGEYQKVTLTQETEGVWWQRTYYVYKLPNGTTIARSEGWNEAPTFEGIDGGVLYLASADTSKSIYTYTYTDANGITHTIGTSTGANTQPTEFTLYERYQSGSKTRLQALKDALTTFTETVNKKAAGADSTLGTADDVNHRIAVVGFASSGDEYNKSKYENTEVFVGATQYTYGSEASGQYGNALQSMNTVAGQNNIADSIGALDAYGGTFTNLGMEMANGIFEKNPIPDGQIRNRVIIVFTDGYPGTNSTSVNSTVANNAVSQGYIAKQSTANGGYGATVYTVGIFSGADGTPVESFSGVSNPNKFMHLLSSNYENAQSYSDSSKYGTATYPAEGGSYYLSAADASTLNNIFEQISDNIESGGTTATLSEETVIKDIIAPAFTLPEGATAANITLETYHCTGENGDAYTWSKNADAMGATATVNDDQVSVTGFDFAENYVGTVTENGNVSYRGHKLVISFNVVPKDGFLGGNAVITNTSAGVYENSDATKPVLTFPQPDVDVAIGDVVINDIETNVYLGGFYSQTIPADQIKAQMTVTVGGVPLDLTAENYGLEAWQTEYVDITVTVKDKNGKDLTGGIESLTEDVEYTVTVTVSPKTETGTATEQSGSGTDTIHVFKPVLTFKDSEVWYGGDAPTDFSSNLQEETWVNSDGTKKHNDTGVQMLNAKPELKLTYAPEDGKIADGKVNTKQDIAVGVAVKIGEADVTDYTTFNHTDCAGKTCTVPTGKEFLLHVKTCQLTITKAGGTDGEPYVFNIYKAGIQGVYTQVTIVPNGNNNRSVTIYELPVGAYTIAEDTGWSWRFSPSYSSAAELSATNSTGTVTCTNAQDAPYWLNGFSAVVKNIFGTAKTANN